MTGWEKLWMILSQLGNVIFFGGDPDETISARAYREGRFDPEWETARLRIDRLLARWGARHCEMTWRQQQRRALARK